MLDDEEDIFIWDEDRLPFNAHSGHRGLIGSTDEGRRLVVIFVKREGNRIRVLTARNASADEKLLYNKRRSSR